MAQQLKEPQDSKLREQERERIQAVLHTTQESLDALWQDNALLEESHNMIETTLKDTLEEATRIEHLLTLVEERYENSKKVYKVLMEKKAIPIYKSLSSFNTNHIDVTPSRAYKDLVASLQ